MKELNKTLENQVNLLKQTNNKIVDELEYAKKKEQEKEDLRKARSNRKRRPKRHPITPEIYDLLIKAVSIKHYTAARLRLAFCILCVTGVRVNELLPIKLNQLKTLFESHWITIDRAKRGPASHKAFLSSKDKTILKEREEDLQLMCYMKKDNDYVFSAEYSPNKMLSREALTRTINHLMRKVSNRLDDRPVLTSHIFRRGFISDLWRDSGDIPSAD